MAAKRPFLEEALGSTPEKVDQSCRDKHLSLVAGEIANWPFVAPFLGLKHSEVEAIRKKWPYQVSEQNFEMLKMWKDKHGQKATYRKLCEAFWKAQEVSVADKVYIIINHDGSSSEGSSDTSGEESSWNTPPQKRALVTSSTISLPQPLFTVPGTSTTLTTIKIGALECFAKYLRMTYEVQIPRFVFQWPPPPTHKVVNLAMFHSQDIVRRVPPDQEFVSSLQRGNVENIMCRKECVTIGGLFDCDSHRRKVVLVEGAPGAGKSTLCWDICQRWKEGELFNQFKVVLYIELRDPEVQSAKQLVDLFPTHAEMTKEDVAAEIEASFGNGVLFVLDGWDEYEPGLREGSFFTKLIVSPHSIRLHYSTLLITSRPVASRELQLYASSRVEIMGFTQAEVHQYFTEALRDPIAVQGLQDQLRERPVIEVSCYLPLNAAIVVHLFKELNHFLPNTLHGVFSAVVCGCIRRYLKKQSGEEVEIPSLDETPCTVQEEFYKLCNLAFEGSMKNKVAFTGQDMESHGLSAKQNPLDLMQVVQSFASRNSKLCYFLHLSVQELLAALHISKLPQSQQVAIFNTVFSNPRFAAVLQFYAALTKLQTLGIREIVVRIAQSGDKWPLLNLINCLYEAQSVTLCCLVASQLKGGLKLGGMELSPLDCLSVGYFLSCICLSTDREFEVDLSKCSVNERSTALLIRGLSKCSDLNVCKPLSGCLALNLSSNSISSSGVRWIADVIGRSSIVSQLDLSGNEIQGEEDGLQYLLQALKTNVSLTLLRLNTMKNLRITEETCVLLVDNSTLKELDLSDNELSDGQLLALGNGLKHNRGLTTLILNGLRHITGNGWMQFVSCLQENDHLTQLSIETFGRADSYTIHQHVEAANSLRQQKCLPLLQVTSSILVTKAM